MRSSTVALIALLAANARVRAEEPVNAEFFEKRVRPILVSQCVTCHGPKKQKGGLRLDSKAGFTPGRRHGALVKAGEPDKSLLMQVDPLRRRHQDAAEGEAARRGHRHAHSLGEGRGAVAGRCGHRPRRPAAAVRPRTRGPRRTGRSSRPATRRAGNPKSESEIRNPIDASCSRSSSDNGLTFAPPADKRTLLRRVTFDLTGLPPTPEEIDAFLKDDVARRLREGGRSAARVARTTASAGAGTGSTSSATPRRTGTSSTSTSPTPGGTATTSIRAFNADLPYDRFVPEHVAGDLLPKPRRHPTDGIERVDPRHRLLVARRGEALAGRLREASTPTGSTTRSTCSARRSSA